MPEQLVGPGFFGKLPSHGDFVTRRLPPALLAPWEAWLDAGLRQSREILGETWLAAYLSSPIWCFSGSAGCCGDRPFCGVLMPSLDRVGRYHPLSILMPLGVEQSPAEIAAGATGWFDQMESLALSCLGKDFDFTAFDTALNAVPVPAGGGRAGRPLEAACPETGPGAVLPILLGRLLEANALSYSLWWTSGSRTIDACCRAYAGLPPIEDFARFLD